MTVYQAADSRTSPQWIEESRPHYQAGYFRMIPDALVRLGCPDASQVYLVLRMFARNAPTITATHKQIAEVAGVSDRQVRRVLETLEQHGFVYVEQRFNGGMQLPSEYSFPQQETPVDMGRTPSPTARTPDTHARTPRPNPPDTMSDLYRKDTNEKELTPSVLPPPVNIDPLADVKPYDLFTWFYGRIGVETPKRPAGKDMAAAKRLIEGGVTISMAAELYDFLAGDPFWANKGVDLSIMASQLPKFLSAKATRPPKQTHKWGVPIEVWEEAEKTPERRKEIMRGIPAWVWFWCDKQEKTAMYQNKLMHGAGLV